MRWTARSPGNSTCMVRLIEPVLLLVMGTVILFVLVALLLPVFDMSTAIS